MTLVRGARDMLGWSGGAGFLGGCCGRLRDPRTLDR